MKNKKETRGGTRPGSGAKPKYNESTNYYQPQAVRPLAQMQC